ncbi:MAG: HAD-IB family phosphatase [Thermoplasmata archaeon]|nr:HAD-IB family phosphatase [Thermoplasmata archaeon]
MARLVVFDMDGVLADAESSWVYVHQHFGVDNEDSLHAYLKGEIDDLEFIRRDIALWKNIEPEISEERVRQVLGGVKLMPGAARTVKELRESNVRTAIVSAGIDLLSERIAQDLGIDLHLANGLKTDSRGRLSGEGILRVKLMDKGDAVVEAMRRLEVKPTDTVSVGNSRHDISMFRKTGKGIAFRPMDDAVRTNADFVVDEKKLTAILDFV